MLFTVFRRPEGATVPRHQPAPTPFDRESFAERARLVEMLEKLPESDWDHDSLCEGWRVREVVAHLTMPYRTRPLAMAAGMLRSRMKFDRFADATARHDTAMYSSAQLLGFLSDNSTTVWHPPGGGDDGALSHDVIHSLDTTEPLGLPGPPAKRIGLVLRHGGARALKHFGATVNQTLVATDTDFTLGTGPVRELPGKEILLIVANRRPARSGSPDD